MKVILDTQAFIWWISDSPRLSAHARQVISTAETALFSAASAWEIAIKAGLGRLELPAGDLGSFVHDQLAENRFEALPVHLAHALAVHSLPLHHRDPFDRMLVAQSKVLKIPVVTCDSTLAQYEIDVIW